MVQLKEKGTKAIIRQAAQEKFEKQAADLVSQMTLEEKLSQMTHHTAGIERLGLKPYGWWNEALHGVARAGVSTVFPQAIGMAASFDEQLLQQTADVVSTEGRAKYHEFQRQGDYSMYKGLTFWSPNINIFRDPRWGRGHETYGEDPYLTARMGAAFVQGLQGDDPIYLKSAACVKHFAVHSGPEGCRHSFNSEVSAKDMAETYLPAFEYCVRKAHVESVMGAYNRLNGEACCGSKWLLHDLLREQWGFRGHVVSDAGALNDLHGPHQLTKDPAETAALALKSGIDLECGEVYEHLPEALERGLITEEDIDVCLQHSLTTRLKLGMLAAPETVPYASIPFEVVACSEHREAARRMAEASMVLLKNDGVLPLRREAVRTIAVIGPNADSVTALLGNYHGTPSDACTVLRGIQEAVADGSRVLYAQGSHLYQSSIDNFDIQGDRLSEAAAVAQRADAVVLCLGLDATIEGEAGDANNLYGSGDKDTLELPDSQKRLLETVAASGKPLVTVVLAGSALALGRAAQVSNAVVQAWYPGEAGGEAVASLLFGDYSPSGRLPVTFYETTEELPPFESYDMEGRTYRYMKNKPLFPFGYGLSYTSFRYRMLSLSAGQIAPGETLRCQVTVENVGERDGWEVVQLYLQDMEASVRVPRWSLCGFRRVFLRAGECQTLEFDILPEQMACVTEEGERVLEPGAFTLYAGGSQPDERSLELCGKAPVSMQFLVKDE